MSKTYKERLAELENDWKEAYGLPDSMFVDRVDMVDKPPHYNQGGIETIDYMKAYSSDEEFRGHLRLTALKYLSRYGKKTDHLEDLRKAQWYLGKLIEEVSC